MKRFSTRAVPTGTRHPRDCAVTSHQRSLPPSRAQVFTPAKEICESYYELLHTVKVAKETGPAYPAWRPLMILEGIRKALADHQAGWGKARAAALEENREEGLLLNDEEHFSSRWRGRCCARNGPRAQRRTSCRRTGATCARRARTQRSAGTRAGGCAQRTGSCAGFSRRRWRSWRWGSRLRGAPPPPRPRLPRSGRSGSDRRKSSVRFAFSLIISCPYIFNCAALTTHDFNLWVCLCCPDAGARPDEASGDDSPPPKVNSPNPAAAPRAPGGRMMSTTPVHAAAAAPAVSAVAAAGFYEQHHDAADGAAAASPTDPSAGYSLKTEGPPCGGADSSVHQQQQLGVALSLQQEGDEGEEEEVEQKQRRQCSGAAAAAAAPPQEGGAGAQQHAQTPAAAPPVPTPAAAPPHLPPPEQPPPPASAAPQQQQPWEQTEVGQFLAAQCCAEAQRAAYGGFLRTWEVVRLLGSPEVKATHSLVFPPLTLAPASHVVATAAPCTPPRVEEHANSRRHPILSRLYPISDASELMCCVFSRLQAVAEQAPELHPTVVRLLCRKAAEVGGATAA